MIAIVIILIIAILIYVYISANIEGFTPGANPTNYNKKIQGDTIPSPDSVADVSSDANIQLTSNSPCSGILSALSGSSSSGSDSSDSSGSSSSSDSSGSSSSSGSSGSSGSTSAWAQKALDYHNNIRSQCSSRNVTMSWDSDLADYAQSYAQKVADAKYYGHDYDGHDCYSYSGYTNGAGENLYYQEGMQSSSTDNQLILAAVNAWASEGYGAEADPDADETGHYTAMNWRTSSKLGCGVGRGSGDNGWAVVSCNYADDASNFCCSKNQYLAFDSNDPAMSEYVTTSGNTTSIDAYGYYIQCGKPLSVQT
jgi:uncharacterized protein YkwD